MKFRVLAIASVLLLGSSFGAHAETICGEKTHTKYGETRIYSKAFVGTCRPDGSCAAVTYTMNVGTSKNDAPLGWDHRMTITRAKSKSPWKIKFTAVSVIPLLLEGISLKFDNGDDDKIVSEFLRQEQSINEISLDTKLSDVFLKKFKKGGNVLWSYSFRIHKEPKADKKAGATKPRGATKTLFSLRGLRKAITWADCAQRLNGF